MRYKRYKKYRRSSTNVITMKFQSFMDISTQKDEMQIISVSAGGANLLARCPAQFAAYKYYRIGNIAVKLVPASTLPVDPSGLNLEVGEAGVDPRDQLTPGMMRITNGEDIFEDLSGLSAEEQYEIYNQMLLDPRWFKWMLQSGVKRHAMPRYWTVGQLHQDKWPGAVFNAPIITSPGAEGQALVGTKVISPRMASATTGTGNVNAYGVEGSSALGLFQTGHKGVLGWLPTDGMQTMPGMAPIPMLTSPPEVEVMKIILPPAHKTRYYYRAYITETVYFREPIVQGGMPLGMRPLDIFHAQGLPTPYLPNAQVATYPTDVQTGGNYGDD